MKKKVEMPVNGPWEYDVTVEPLLNPKTGEDTGRQAVYHGTRLIHVAGKNYTPRQNSEAHKVVATIYKDQQFVDFDIESDREGNYHAILWVNSAGAYFGGEQVNIGLGIINTHDGSAPFSFYPAVTIGEHRLEGAVIPVARPISIYKGKDSAAHLEQAIRRIDAQFADWTLRLMSFVTSVMHMDMTLVDATVYAHHLVSEGAKDGKAESHRLNRVLAIVKALKQVAGADGRVSNDKYMLTILNQMQGKIARREMGKIDRLYELSVGKHRAQQERLLKKLSRPVPAITQSERDSAAKILQECM